MGCGGMGCQVEWHGMSQSVGYMASHIFGVRTSLRASAHDQLRLPAAAHCAEVWQHCLYWQIGCVFAASASTVQAEARSTQRHN